MYGTVARMRIKPGMEGQMIELNRSFGRPPGAVAEYLYRTDADPAEHYLTVVFESREAYKANAARPEMHAQYLQYRELLTEEPEWHDGEIVSFDTWGAASS